MNSRDFAFWLQGFFELSDKNASLSVEQTRIIKNHLNLVFKHEIDPSFGDEETQLVLNKIHAGEILYDTYPSPIIDVKDVSVVTNIPSETAVGITGITGTGIAGTTASYSPIKLRC